MGTPSSFVRVAGCNLRCTWCDSPKTSWAPEGEWHTVDELVAWCEQGPRHVVLTGGEPLLFEEIATLSQRLRPKGHHVTIETAGTVDLPEVECDLASLSPKLSHSVPHHDPKWGPRHDSLRLVPTTLTRLTRAFPHQLKFVVRAESDAVLDADLEEIDTLLSTLPHVAAADVFLMPEGTQAPRLREHYGRVAAACARRGNRLGQRLHIMLYGHTPGT